MPRRPSSPARHALLRGALAAALATTALLAPADRATAGGGGTYLRFTKHTPDDSRLTYVRHGRPVVTYRAGSGKVPDECLRGRGWLPDGTYTLGRHHRAYDGNLIKGYAVELGTKRCHDGTDRTELFIHSQMTRSGGQGRGGYQRWDGPADYTSHGCVKLRPADIKELYRILDRHGWPTTLRVTGG
ncbi:murein L,D-transpeptidase [Streptomyces luteoverticillatus]|uniref:Murein L,D-transpeptidase n=1 Tax=Streptomyces luteoverticillatus TaxID=66425 RepID=A0A3S9PRB1_STRLT|nr:L,D-transpeptidase [Streptomyces luteoverticillatus]AZQ74854.1 murein L,D-transpeptidase [Streptomyces luteoverticillatus]